MLNSRSRSQINIRLFRPPHAIVLAAVSALMLSALAGLETHSAASAAQATAAGPKVTLTVYDFVKETPIGGATVTMFAGAVTFASGITSSNGVFVGAGAPLNQVVRVEWKQIGYVRSPQVATLTVAAGDNPLRGTLLEDTPDQNYMLRIPARIIEAAKQDQANKELAYRVQWERVTLLPADAQASVAKALSTSEGQSYLANVASFKAAAAPGGAAVTVPNMKLLPTELASVPDRVKAAQKADKNADRPAAEKAGSSREASRGSSVP
jgi:hypothetical protein